MTVPAPGRRGPRRPRIDDVELAALLDEARELGEQLREVNMRRTVIALRRRTIIRQLRDGGLSVRAIASALRISTSTVGEALAGE